jgi:hypothetical protein
VFLPVVSLLLAVVLSPWLLTLLMLYPIQVWRLSRLPGGWIRALFLVFGKFAEASGALRFFARLLLRRQGRLIEYK